MSAPTISTGSIPFKRAAATPKQRALEDNDPLHIAIIADFSGRGSRKEQDVPGLKRRKLIEIDRDNFDEVFSRLNVRLKLPFQEAPIHFGELDELHPDILLEQLDLFADFRQLLRQLGKPESFEQTAARIRSWAEVQGEASADEVRHSEQGDCGSTPAGTSATGREQPAEDLFAAVLSESGKQAASEASGQVNRLIQSIIAPYIEPREHPDLSKYQLAVEDAMAQTLRRIMHAGSFQRLEANWRALQLLVSRLHTDSSLKLFVLDASRDELLADLDGAAQLEETGLYQRLVLMQQEPGATPFALINADITLGEGRASLQLAAALAMIAEQAGSLAVCAASGHLAGCADIATQIDPADWDHATDPAILNAWQALRAQSSARSLVACAPRFLARLPYGRRGQPIEQFPFEELGGQHAHAFYCWAPGSYLLTLSIAQQFLNDGWSSACSAVTEITDLPVHVYTDEDGDSVATACAEVFLLDTAATALAEAGIYSLRSIRGRDAVLLPPVRSAHPDGSLAGVFMRSD